MLFLLSLMLMLETVDSILVPNSGSWNSPSSSSQWTNGTLRWKQSKKLATNAEDNFIFVIILNGDLTILRLKLVYTLLRFSFNHFSNDLLSTFLFTLSHCFKTENVNAICKVTPHKCLHNYKIMIKSQKIQITSFCLNSQLCFNSVTT